MIYKQNTPLSAKSHRKKLFLILLPLLILAAIGSFLIWRNYADDKAAADQKARDEAQTSSAKKLSESKSGQEAEVNPTNEEVKQNVQQGDATVAISSFSQANGQVVSSATISPGNGECVFTYTIDQDKPVIRRSTSSNSVCTASAPEVEFSRLGQWNLNVTVYINNTKSEANQSVTIQ